MSTFTGRELEFVASLNKNWWTLYWRELARLCRNEDAAPNEQQNVHALSPGSKGFVRRSAARILAFAPELRGCEEAVCPFCRRKETEADEGVVLHRRVELGAANR
jgi:hypothetical protein